MLCCPFIGLAQYSGDPKTMWHLNSHKTRTELLDAVANLPYKGGNTLTGKSYYILIYTSDPASFIGGKIPKCVWKVVMLSSVL